jgi:hypothetical protein
MDGKKQGDKSFNLYELGMYLADSLEKRIDPPASSSQLIGIIGLETRPPNPFVKWLKYNEPALFAHIEKEYEALQAVAKELDRLEKPILEFGRISEYHPLDNTTKKLVEERFAVLLNKYEPALHKLVETIRNITDIKFSRITKTKRWTKEKANNEVLRIIKDDKIQPNKITIDFIHKLLPGIPRSTLATTETMQEAIKLKRKLRQPKTVRFTSKMEYIAEEKDFGIVKLHAGSKKSKSEDRE